MPLCCSPTNDASGESAEASHHPFDEEMSKLFRIYTNQRNARLCKQQMRANVKVNAQVGPTDSPEPSKMPAPQRFVRKHKAMAIKTDGGVSNACSRLPDQLGGPAIENGSEKVLQADDAYDVLLDTVMHVNAKRIGQEACETGDLDEVRLN